MDLKEIISCGTKDWEIDYENWKYERKYGIKK